MLELLDKQLVEANFESETSSPENGCSVAEWLLKDSDSSSTRSLSENCEEAIGNSLSASDCNKSND